MASMEGFTEGALLSLLFIGLLTIAIGAMNLAYDKNIDLGLSDTSGSEQAFINSADSAQKNIEGGEITFADNGIEVKSSWGLAKDAMSVTLKFITGGFIEKLADSWGFAVGEAGTLFIRFFRILFTLAMIYAMIYAIFKVVL